MKIFDLNLLDALSLLGVAARHCVYLLLLLPQTVLFSLK